MTANNSTKQALALSRKSHRNKEKCSPQFKNSSKKKKNNNNLIKNYQKKNYNRE